MGKASRHRAAAKVAADRSGATTSQSRPRTPPPARSFMAPMGFGSGVSGGHGPIQAPYHAASYDPSIPRVANMGPRSLMQFQPMLRWLQRHYHRNNSLIKRIVAKEAMNVVGTGPIPTSRFEVLNDLWQGNFWPNVDVNGVHGGGDWLREDVFKTEMLDADVFLRKSCLPSLVDPMGRPLRSIQLPLQYEIMHADQIPWWWQTMVDPNGGGTIAGIEFAPGGKQRLAYWGYTGYPGDYPNVVSNLLLQRFPASEIIHHFTPGMSNSPRGECQLASAILMAIKVERFIDADFTRLDVAARFCGYIKETVQTAGESQLAGERIYDDLMNLLAMDPGQLFRLPPGMEIQFASPPQPTPGGVDMLKFLMSIICAAVGIPLYEIDMTYADLSDRVMKVAGISYQQQVDVKRSRLRSQVMAPIWKSFVDVVIAMGLWTPDSFDALVQAYQDSWRWPLIKQTQMTQELPVLIQARDAGFTSTDAVAQSYFGQTAREVARDEAAYQASLRALGFSPTPPAPEPVAPVADAEPKKLAKPGEPAPAETPEAPAAPSSAAPSGKSPVPTWDSANSPLAASMLTDASATEKAAYDSTR